MNPTAPPQDRILPDGLVALTEALLPIRAALLDIASELDRVQRSAAVRNNLAQNQSWRLIHDALRLLADRSTMVGEAHQPIPRAEAIHLLFSIPYDPAWSASSS